MNPELSSQLARVRIDDLRRRPAARTRPNLWDRLRSIRSR